MTHHSFDFDLAVIGAGSGGFAAARAAAANGFKVALLDGATELGGLCILRGCMPTKALLYATEVLHLAHNAGTWGIRTGPVSFDYPALMARKKVLIDDFASYRREQLAKGDFTLLRAHAHFQDPHTLKLSDGRTVSADKFIIATGSKIAAPPLPQLKQAGYLTSDDVLELERLPKSAIVLGGGAVGVECAQYFARLGVKVSLVQRSQYLLKEFDRDATQALETVLRREGMDIYTGTQLTDAWQRGHQKGVTFQQAGKLMELGAEEIVFALGRTANTAGLGLEKIGVAMINARVITDATMQTTVPHIYAVGDCTGQHEIVHIAIQQAEIAAYNVTHPGTPRQIDYRLLTMVIFTEPQLAVVGLTECMAQVQNIPHRAASYAFSDHGKSLIMEAKDGFVKLLADPHSGEILGGCCVGPMGGELIHEIIAAMHKRMTVHELAAMPHYHPTLAEIWTYPAEELAASIPLRQE